MISLKNLL